MAGENGNPVTYCFVVTNTGDTYMKDIEVNDPDLGGLIGTIPGPLAPTISTTLAIPTTISGDLVNVATATGTPTDPEGQEIPGVGKPSDQDTAEVVDQGVQPPTALGEEDQPRFEGQRKLYLPAIQGGAAEPIVGPQSFDSAAPSDYLYVPAVEQ